MAVPATPDEVLRIVSTVLDAGFYRAVYSDLAEGQDPLAHYVEHGWREGRDPAAWFSTADYLADHPDVRAAGHEPLSHFLLQGRLEGREIRGSQHGPAWRLRRAKAVPALEPEVQQIVEPAAISNEERALLAAAFDETYYRLCHPDVGDAGADPFEHFLAHGWREGRDPNPDFSVDDYLEMYADVREAGVNPLLHYLQSGRAEGRIPKHALGFRYPLLMNLRTPEERVARAKSLPPEAPPVTAEGLAAALADSRSGLRDLHLTFSHDNFTANYGGVQQCLAREAARAAELGRDHLHLFPAKGLPVVRAPGEAGKLGVVLNGRTVGTIGARAIQAALDAAVGPRGRRTLAIHSLLGHRPDEVAGIAKAAGLTEGFFWLHDFASLCAGFHLLRNDVQDCAAPPPDSAACSVCVYRPMRARHLEQHARLFDLLDLTVLSPSQSALELWKSSWSYPTAGEAVVPHAVLQPQGRASTHEGPLRVAYAGLPRPLKGWPIFRELALRLRDDDRYSLFHLGGFGERGLPVEFHEVVVDDAKPAAMREALSALHIDVVIAWPLCRETFSFIAYEAVAAGCALLTWPDSGNVAAFVEQGAHGWVLADETALTEAFESGRVLELARARRLPHQYDLRFSAHTFEVAGA